MLDVYNDSGDRFYNGRPITFVRNGSGAATVLNITLSYITLSETSGILMWPDISFTADAGTTFDIEEIPVQITGNQNRNARVPISIRDVTSGSFSAGELVIEAIDRQFRVRLYSVGDIGGVNRLIAGSFVVGRAYTISAGHTILFKSFA